MFLIVQQHEVNVTILAKQKVGRCNTTEVCGRLDIGC